MELEFSFVHNDSQGAGGEVGETTSVVNGSCADFMEPREGIYLTLSTIQIAVIIHGQ